MNDIEKLMKLAGLKASTVTEAAFDESVINEDWGSSDWSALLNSMKKSVDRGQSLEDAAYDAAVFYHDHMGYPDADDAVHSILNMWKVRKMDTFDPKNIGEAEGDAGETTLYILIIRGGRAGEDLESDTLTIPNSLASGEELWNWYNDAYETSDLDPPDIVPNGEGLEDWNKIFEAIKTGMAYVYWDVYGEGVIGITANRSKTKELKKKVQEEFYNMDDDDPFGDEDGDEDEDLEEEVDHTKPANSPDTMEYDLRAFDFKGRGSLPNRYVQSRYSDNPLKNAKQIADESTDPLMAELEAFLMESSDEEDGSDEAHREREDKRKAAKKKAEKKGEDLEEAINFQPTTLDNTRMTLKKLGWAPDTKKPNVLNRFPYKIMLKIVKDGRLRWLIKYQEYGYRYTQWHTINNGYGLENLISAAKEINDKQSNNEVDEGQGLQRAAAHAKKSRGETLNKKETKALDADTLAKRMQDGKSKKKVAEADYKPGVTVLTRGMHVPTDEEWAAVKGIQWPYGVAVQFDELNHDVTFKTAKMKTVAKLLSKVIDFGDTTAADVLDLPMELVYH